ncbi:hypothetical protein QOT17_022528 [Balamuthia mandrillaris]
MKRQRNAMKSIREVRTAARLQQDLSKPHERPSDFTTRDDAFLNAEEQDDEEADEEEEVHGDGGGRPALDAPR